MQALRAKDGPSLPVGMLRWCAQLQVFYLFVLYAQLDCMHALVSTIIMVGNPFRQNAATIGFALRATDVFALVLSGAFAFALLLFVGLHGCLISNGQTTIKMGPRSKNPYDLGFRRNWHAVFGPSIFWGLLPVAGPCDGLRFETKEGYSQVDGGESEMTSHEAYRDVDDRGSKFDVEAEELKSDASSRSDDESLISSTQDVDLGIVSGPYRA